jgi:hypothetical protein
MLHALRRLTDEAIFELVKFQPDEAISRIVSSWPGRIDNTRAIKLGFVADDNFDIFIHQHIADKNQIA